MYIYMCIHLYRYTLVGGLEHFFNSCPSIGNFIIPTDELIFFRGVGIPPTSKSVGNFNTTGINTINGG